MRWAAIALLMLAGCSKPADLPALAPVEKNGDLIVVRDRMAIYYDERLFRAVAEWTRSGSKVTPEFDPTPNSSNCGLLYSGAELRVLDRTEEGTKVLIEKFKGEDEKGRSGRIGWIPVLDVEKNRAPITPP